MVFLCDQKNLNPVWYFKSLLKMMISRKELSEFFNDKKTIQSLSKRQNKLIFEFWHHNKKIFSYQKSVCDFWHKANIPVFYLIPVACILFWKASQRTSKTWNVPLSAVCIFLWLQRSCQFVIITSRYIRVFTDLIII